MDCLAATDANIVYGRMRYGDAVHGRCSVGMIVLIISLHHLLGVFLTIMLVMIPSTLCAWTTVICQFTSALRDTR